MREKEVEDRVLNQLGKDIGETVKISKLLNREAGFTICEGSYPRQLIPSQTVVSRRYKEEMDMPQCPDKRKRIGTFHTHLGEEPPRLSRNDETTARRNNEIICLSNIKGQMICKNFGKEKNEGKRS